MAHAANLAKWGSILQFLLTDIERRESILNVMISEVRKTTMDCWKTVEEACKIGNEIVTGLREDAEKVRLKFIDANEALNDAEKAASDMARRVKGFKDLIDDMEKHDAPLSVIKNYAERILEELNEPNEKLIKAQDEFEKLLSETKKEMNSLSSKISEARTDLKADKRKSEAEIDHNTALVGAGTSALTVVGTAAACFLTFSNPIGIAAAVVAGASALGTGATAVKHSRSKSTLDIDHKKQMDILHDIELEVKEEFDKIECGRECLEKQIKEIFAAQAELARHLNQEVREMPRELHEKLKNLDAERFFLDSGGIVDI